MTVSGCRVIHVTGARWRWAAACRRSSALHVMAELSVYVQKPDFNLLMLILFVRTSASRDDTAGLRHKQEEIRAISILSPTEGNRIVSLKARELLQTKCALQTKV